MKIERDKISYVLGYSLGSDFKSKGFEIDGDIFMEAFSAALTGKPSRMRGPEMQQVMQAFQSAMRDKQQARQTHAAQANVDKGLEYLRANGTKKDVTTTPSGLQYRVIKAGSGKTPTATDKVVTHYEGKTLDGKIFDSSVQRGQPASFPVNGVIPGWQEALTLMSEGAKYELVIPSNLAYGAAGAGNAIGPHETLIFEVELLEVK